MFRIFRRIRSSYTIVVVCFAHEFVGQQEDAPTRIELLGSGSGKIFLPSGIGELLSNFDRSEPLLRKLPTTKPIVEYYAMKVGTLGPCRSVVE